MVKTVRLAKAISVEFETRGPGDVYGCVVFEVGAPHFRDLLRGPNDRRRSFSHRAGDTPL